MSFVPAHDKPKLGNVYLLRYSLTTTAPLLRFQITLCYWVLANQEFDLVAPGKSEMQLKPDKEKVLGQHGLLAEGLGQLLELFRGSLERGF